MFIDNLVDGFGLVTQVMHTGRPSMYRVMYCSMLSQEAWIQQATVKSNILFGREMKPAFYLQVVNACALQEVSPQLKGSEPEWLALTPSIISITVSAIRACSTVFTPRIKLH